MAENAWTTSYLMDVEGFPKLLYATMVRLGILDRPEYVGREYEEYGTERCEVIVYVGKSMDHPDMEPWKVNTTGFRFEDTYQVAARKALRYLCQMYERPLARTPMRVFPPFERERPTWQARLRTLEGCGLREDDPTVVYLSIYLMVLDDRYDKQASKLRAQIRRAEEAETTNRRLCVDLSEAEVRIAEAKSREAAAVEAMMEAEDRHTQQLKDAYLATRAKRRALQISERVVLEGVPLMPPGSRMLAEAPPAPPPSEASQQAPEPEAAEEEAPLPLTQPPPKE